VNADQRRRAGDKTFRSNCLTAHIAYFVYARIDFGRRRVDRAKVLISQGEQRRDVLPLEGDGRALRVMLVVTARRSLARAGHDSGEVPLQFSDPMQCLFAIGIQPGLSWTRFSHLRRLSFKLTIPNAGT
jgi:hypothetical protein